MFKVGKYYVLNEDEYRTIHNSIYLTRHQTEISYKFSKKLKEQGRENEDKLPLWAIESIEGMYETSLEAEKVMTYLPE